MGKNTKVEEWEAIASHIDSIDGDSQKANLQKKGAEAPAGTNGAL
jgi:hypothetical protein